MRKKLLSFYKKNENATWVSICIAIILVFFFFGNIAQKSSAPTNPALSHKDEFPEALREYEHYKSRTNSPYTIIEYFDLDCPYCRELYLEERKVYASIFAGNINHIYRFFPLTNIHPDAAKKTLVAECVAKNRGEDVFFKFIDHHFLTTSTETTYKEFLELAEKYLTKEQIVICQNDTNLKEMLTWNIVRATQAGVFSTPTMILLNGGKKVEQSNLLGIKNGMNALYGTLELSHQQ
jgi:protein-disulfide isomerase